MIVDLDLGSLVAAARRPLLACPKRIEDDMSCKVWAVCDEDCDSKILQMTSGRSCTGNFRIFRMTETLNYFSPFIRRLFGLRKSIRKICIVIYQV